MTLASPEVNYYGSELDMNLQKKTNGITYVVCSGIKERGARITVCKTAEAVARN